MGETPFACAERETLEEAGVHVKAEKLIALTNDIFDPDLKHYITIFVSCRLLSENEEPRVSLVFSCATDFTAPKKPKHPSFTVGDFS